MRFCSSTRYCEGIMKGEIGLFISDFHRWIASNRALQKYLKSTAEIEIRMELLIHECGLRIRYFHLIFFYIP
jgi:hypothetical protein